MTFKTQALSMAVACAVLLGCGNESAKLVPQSVFPKEDVTEKPTDLTMFYPKVDILFVIDSSGSMQGPQSNMRANAHVFADEIAKMKALDFHIGVTTTDMDDCSPLGEGNNCGQLTGDPVYVDRNTPNLVRVLAERMMVGTNGSATEVMFTPTTAALSRDLEMTVNSGFHRPEAFLAVIFLTDADDQSKMSAHELYRLLAAKKGSTEKVLGYGVMRTLATATKCSGSETITGKLESFLDMVVNADKNRKNIFSLCATDYGIKLAEFARDIVKYAAGKVKLTGVPDVKTIKVSYGTQSIPNDLQNGWVYEPSTNSIVFASGIQWDTAQGGAGLMIDYKTIDVTPR